MAGEPNQECPCRSGKRYGRCCLPWHRGTPAPNPEALMRSRFAAFALGLVDYLIDTTDPDGRVHREDRAEWAEELAGYCREVSFDSLEIEGAGVRGAEAWVKFRAGLTRKGRDASFTERSRFVQRNGLWVYHDGVVEPA